MKYRFNQLICLLCFLHASSIIAQNVEGDWFGYLKMNSQRMKIVFHIHSVEKQWEVTMDSPDQKVFGLEMQEVSIKENQISVFSSNTKIRYEGKREGDSLVGKFIQGAIQLNLNLGPLPSNPSWIPRRPQTPTPPFDYLVEEINIPTQTNEVNLAGTLTLPSGKGPFPLAVLISGSGPQNRNEEIFNHQPFWVIADFFAQNGIATFRYDDRGVGKSTGNFQRATSADFASDAAAAVAFLKKNALFQKIGLIGHSEGGMIAPMLAAKDSSIAFVILMAGPGVPIADLLVAQNDAIATIQGLNEKQRKSNASLNRACYTILNTTESDEKAKRKMNKLFTDAKISIAQIEQMQSQLFSPWFRYFVHYDPSKNLQQIKCPVYALNGDKDVQVAAPENLHGIEENLKLGGNSSFTVETLPNINHLFQETSNFSIEEYGELEETIAPIVLEKMMRWIITNTH